jgi:hypothetical protein
MAMIRATRERLMVDFTEMLAKLDDEAQNSFGLIRRSPTSADCARLRESRSSQRDEEKGLTVIRRSEITSGWTAMCSAPRGKASDG